MKAAFYIARKEDFQKAIVEPNELNVIAIYPDAKILFTKLSGYIVESVFQGANHFDVKTSEMKGDHYICVIVH